MKTYTLDDLTIKEHLLELAERETSRLPKA